MKEVQKLKMIYPFQLVSVIDGEGTVNDMPIKKGDRFIICSDVDLVHYEGGLELMVTTLYSFKST